MLKTRRRRRKDSGHVIGENYILFVDQIYMIPISPQLIFQGFSTDKDFVLYCSIVVIIKDEKRQKDQM